MAIKISGTEVIDDNRNITTSIGTVDGRDVAADGIKLDGVETGANVTDTANVTAAGALMDSELASVTAVKATTGTFLTADQSKLDGIEAGATADQTKADIDALNINADLLDGQHGAYYTGYTDTAVSNLVDSSPATLNTLNELAAALGDDVNFSTTVTDSIATKLPLTGGAMTGAITTNSTFDGRDIATDGTKLDGIETGADVTDATNVSAAGALMDSEVTNLSQVKAFNSSDYATAAQGTTANAALPKAGGAMTGPITTNSTFDGRDVATDGTKLDGIAAGANVGLSNVVEDTSPQLGGNLDVLATEITTSTTNGNVKITPDGTGVVEVKGAGGADGTLQLNCSANSHGVKIKSPPHSAGASYTLTLPNDDGTASQFLQTDGSGVLSWATASGGGGDADTVDGKSISVVATLPSSPNANTIYFVTG